MPRCAVADVTAKSLSRKKKLGLRRGTRLLPENARLRNVQLNFRGLEYSTYVRSAWFSRDDTVGCCRTLTKRRAEGARPGRRDTTFKPRCLEKSCRFISANFVVGLASMLDRVVLGCCGKDLFMSVYPFLLKYYSRHQLAIFPFRSLASSLFGPWLYGA